jgi:proline iminopeptidase
MYLQVDNFLLYYEIHGKGTPVVVLHGGPGGGISKHNYNFFNLKKWCVIVFDQRGCGRSLPFGSLENNTTHHLIEDINYLRKHLKITNWFVSGGSWGTTLALAYAEKYPENVIGLLLRGFTFCDNFSQEWLYQYNGTPALLFPKQWKKFVSVLPVELHKAHWLEIMKYYKKFITFPKFIKAWNEWEDYLSFFKPKTFPTNTKEAYSTALIENHYFINNCWLNVDDLLKNAFKLKNKPIIIVHGQYDMVCPIESAFKLKEYLPNVHIIVVPNAGHAASEKGIHKALKRVQKLLIN